MRLNVLLRKRYGAALPALDIMVWMGGRPFRQFGLRPHQALHRRDPGKDKAAFLALVRCRGQARDKQEFDHGSFFPVVCLSICVRAREKHRLKSVNAPLRLCIRAADRTMRLYFEQIVFGCCGQIAGATP